MGKEGGKRKKKKEGKRKKLNHIYVPVSQMLTQGAAPTMLPTGTTNYQHFLISGRLSSIIDHYLPVSLPAFLSFTLVLCHGSAKLLLQFLDFPFVVSDQAVLLCVVLLE